LYASHGEDIAIGALVPPSSEVPRGRAHAGYGRIARISNFPPSLSVPEHEVLREITHRRTTHESLKIPPNASEGLVTSHTPLVQSSWAEPSGDKLNPHDFPGG
jgi:hypothetical protein